MKEESVTIKLNLQIETVGTSRVKAYRLTCGNVSVVDDNLKEGKARIKELLADYAQRGDNDKSAVVMAWRDSIGIAQQVMGGYNVSVANGKCTDYLRKHIAGSGQFCGTLETAQSKLALEIAIREYEVFVDWQEVPDIVLAYCEPPDIKVFEWYIEDCLKSKALQKAGYSSLDIPLILTQLYKPKEGEQYPDLKALVDNLIKEHKETQCTQ